MNFILVLSILIMSYISYRYNKVDCFQSFLGNLLVQLFHIATLVFILFMSIKHGSFIVWIFCFFGANTIINNVLKLISDIINTFLIYNEENIESENTGQSQETETKADNDKEDR